MAIRLRGRYGYPEDEPFRVTFHESKLEAPLHWKKPCRIFVCSMGEPFHSDVTWRMQVRIYSVMERADWHTFQVLTKRPRRMLDFYKTLTSKEHKLNHIWTGASASVQRDANAAIMSLVQIPSKIRFLSLEPLLERISLRKPLKAGSIQWVIVGGESGGGARPMHPDWARQIRDECAELGIPFFFKGWGRFAPEIPFEPSVGLIHYGKQNAGKILPNITNSNSKLSQLGRNNWYAFDQIGTPISLIARSKKAAGFELDGQVYQNMPEGGTS